MIGHQGPQQVDQRPKGGDGRDEPPLQPARRADTDQLPHEQPEIEGAGMNQ